MDRNREMEKFDSKPGEKSFRLWTAITIKSVQYAQINILF